MSAPATPDGRETPPGAREAPGGQVRRFDVVVVGGSSGGVGAALGAGRLGARVALIEDTPVLGGMLANGVSNIDAYSYESLSGVFEEFRRAVVEHYRPVAGTDPAFRRASGMPRHLDGRSHQAHAAGRGGQWEPRVAAAIFADLVARVPTVEVFYNRAATGVLMAGRRVTGVVTERLSGPSAHSPVVAGERIDFHADVVIDATHEADVAAWAGAPYRVGREARSRLEPHAGDVTFYNNTGEFLPGSTGRQDRAVVSYGLRLTVKHYGDGTGAAPRPPRPVPAPPGYDPAAYAHSSYGGQISRPGRTAEMNANPVGNEDQEANWAWPEATREERARIFAHYRDHALGFLHYLQTERGLGHLGLSDLDYPDNGNLPYRLFVREARRVVGEATMTEADVNPFLAGTGLTPPPRPDSVAVGHYPIDSKPLRRKRDLSTPDKGNGDFFLVDAAAPFQVPFGALVPRDGDGLLVPVALSATHVAFSAVRMDPTWTVTGQAAGVAAALSRRQGGEVRDVSLDAVQRELLRQKCALAFYWDLPAEHPAFAPVQWLSVRGAVSGYPDRTVRPDAPLTRAEAASLLVRAFDLWPSVSNAHFTDVPYTHWAFRAVETLFDRGALRALGVLPLWPEAGPYEARRHSSMGRFETHRTFAPDRAVSAGELSALLEALGVRAADGGGAVASRATRGEAPGDPAPPAAQTPLSRGEACAVVAALLGLPERGPETSGSAGV